MANLGNVVYLSKTEYDTLITNGSITKGSVTVTYNPNDLYLVPNDVEGSETITVSETEEGNTKIDLNANITSKVNRALLTPTAAPASRVVPTIGTNNAQQNLPLGSGFKVDGNVLDTALYYHRITLEGNSFKAYINFTNKRSEPYTAVAQLAAVLGDYNPVAATGYVITPSGGNILMGIGFGTDNEAYLYYTIGTEEETAVDNVVNISDAVITI